MVISFTGITDMINEWKDLVIFNTYKNESLRSAESFYRLVMRKFKIDDRIRLSKVYNKIVNYQINKYGTSLTTCKLLNTRNKNFANNKTKHRLYASRRYENDKNLERLEDIKDNKLRSE